ncbi:chromatin/chromatin-binding, or -regulatory protein [Lithospermum erythrorhizon]|uniref:Chromatin/chromatin-binding, or -regulatory protein n=1 Tax=Lithospermum erythrorhizon TaxID=34254 RepID=A0AAV3NI65_LITER
MKEKMSKASEMKRKKKNKAHLHQFQNNPNILTNSKTTPSSSPNCTLPPKSSPPPSPPPPDSDDEDERKQKKVKLVVRLPTSNLNQLNKIPKIEDSDSGSGCEDSEDDVDLGGSPKKRKINDEVYRSGDIKEEKVWKAIDVLHGSQLETGPMTPLPDKKLLLFILDRLQKKDTHGVFSEPVDPNELPDYHEIVEQPMDFGTLRKKLDGRAYKNLEELEADILLICSNAMQYNAPDTVYYRQARSIQEIARRDFANLRHEGDDGEPQPKVVRRGRPPGKTQKKHIEKSPVDRIGAEISSDVTLASGEEKGAGPNSSYCLRKTSSLYKFRSSDGFSTPNRSSIGENGSEWSIDWNNEFPASILRADMKHGNKNITVDITKRDSYREYQPLGSDNDLLRLLNIDVDMKRLIPVGLNFAQHAYPRSLAKFAAILGQAAWKVASRKLESVLPAGVKFGPGWVGETEALPSFSGVKQKSPGQLAADRHSSGPVTTPGENPALHQSKSSEQMVEAVRLLNSQNELPVQSGGAPWGVQGCPPQALQKSMFHPSRNGFSGVYGQSLSQLGMSSPAVAPGQSGPQEGLSSYQVPGVVHRNDASSSSVHPVSSSSVHHTSSYDNLGFEESKFSHSSNMVIKGKSLDSSTKQEVNPGRSDYEYLPAELKPRLPIPPDLNVRVPGPSSPSSSLVGSSPQQQPDLALQLVTS